MRRIPRLPAGLVLAGALSCVSSASLAHDEDYFLTTGLDYSSGRYGTSQTTEIWYLPVITRMEWQRWTFKLTLPYVRMTAPTGGVIVGYDGNGTPIRAGAGQRVTQSGMGDVVAAATYSLVEREDLLLDVTGKIKFGTASESKGLGTGENDFLLGLDAYFPTGGATTPFLSLGGKSPGDPAGQTLKDTWQAGVGLAYKFSPAWSGGAMFDWRSAASASSVPQREFTLYGVYKSANNWKLQGYAYTGFSDASADYGLGLMASFGL